MDITVKMTPEEYDYFRQYQRKKDFFERKLKAEAEKFHKEHEKLCSAVMSALGTEDFNIYENDKAVGMETVAAIIDQDAAIKALEIATEWYA